MVTYGAVAATFTKAPQPETSERPSSRCLCCRSCSFMFSQQSSAASPPACTGTPPPLAFQARIAVGVHRRHRSGSHSRAAAKQGQARVRHCPLAHAQPVQSVERQALSAVTTVMRVAAVGCHTRQAHREIDLRTRRCSCTASRKNCHPQRRHTFRRTAPRSCKD